MLRLALLAALAAASLAVEQWTDDDFAANLDRHAITLVKFYAPWCGHCKSMAPEFEKAADALALNDPPVMLAKVDCTADGKQSCTKHGVSGYPTLKIFRGDVAEDYNGPREFDGIVKHMRGKAGPTSRVLTAPADLARVLGGAGHAVVGYFTDAESAQAKVFKTLADTLSDDYTFAHTSAADVLAAAGKSDQVVIHRAKAMANKFEPAELEVEGASAAEMRHFVQSRVHGLAGQKTSANAKDFKNPLVTVYYDVDYVRNAKGTNYWRNRVMKVAKEVREAGGLVNFAVASHEDSTHEMGEMALSFTDKPVVGARDDKDQKFVMAEEFSVDALRKFVEDMVAGALEPYLKSEALPADNTAPVKVVVAKNFDEIVNDPERDVLVEFYAPWCGHCKTLAPKLDELGEALAAETGVTIAKMDATANDVPAPYQVSGFPTLYYAPKNSKQTPKKYEGGREVKDFMKYLAKESTDGLAGWDRAGKKTKKEL